jgi:hypothetical protein
MARPDDRGGFRARVAYAIRAIASGQTDGRDFDNCFEMHDGDAVVTAIMREAEPLARLYCRAPSVHFDGCKATAEKHDGADLDALSRSLIKQSRIEFEAMMYRMRSEQAARQSEPVTLADGTADQSLIPGVAAIPLTARQLAQERARREARRGAAGLPCGGLWDETAQAQGSLF